MNVALLTASGVGSRMGQDIPKQFLHVKDKPVIVYTLERFQNNPQIDAIILVTLPNWFGFVWAYAKQFGITKLKWVVAGGETGQESIFNGLCALKDECPSDTVVLVHDGNRPMVDDNIINDSLAVFKKYNSAVAAIPCTEVVFVSKDGHASQLSIPREELMRTQTPHTYFLNDLYNAHLEARKNNITNTAASCSLMESLGKTTYFSKGSEKNLKITTTDDIEIFKSLLTVEKDSWMK